MKAGIFAGVALAVAAAGLAACGQEQPAAPPMEQARELRFTNGRLALPPVKGNPGAVYFDISNGGKTDVAFRTAQVSGAQSAMMHATNGTTMDDLMLQQVKAGETVKFEPGGSHIMAMGLADTLKAGGKTDVTLHFSDGSKAVFPVEIIAPGDAR